MVYQKTYEHMKYGENNILFHGIAGHKLYVSDLKPLVIIVAFLIEHIGILS